MWDVIINKQMNCFYGQKSLTNTEIFAILTLHVVKYSLIMIILFSWSWESKVVIEIETQFILRRVALMLKMIHFLPQIGIKKHFKPRTIEWRCCVLIPLLLITLNTSIQILACAHTVWKCLAKGRLSKGVDWHLLTWSNLYLNQPPSGSRVFTEVLPGPRNEAQKAFQRGCFTLNSNTHDNFIKEIIDLKFLDVSSLCQSSFSSSFSL